MVQGRSYYGLIENGALVISDDMIKWFGPQKELPDEIPELKIIIFYRLLNSTLLNLDLNFSPITTFNH